MQNLEAIIKLFPFMDAAAQLDLRKAAEQYAAKFPAVAPNRPLLKLVVGQRGHH